MTETEREELTQHVLHAFEAVFPEVESTTEYSVWKQCERLVPHALPSLHRAAAPERSLTLASLAFKVAQYLRERGQYEEAEPLYQRALHMREQGLEPDHPHIAASLRNLAVLYWREGKYAEAEPLFQRALSIVERTLGPDHAQVAGALNNLALLYSDQGRYAEAEPLYQHSLHIFEQTLNPEHPQLALAINNLAALYAFQGRYREAEPLFQRALHIWGRLWDRSIP
ncbi:tetratricopeptide repeat protein [Ktedonospora formicarum]|nr:tetratricopeptide repeat protein [Ktedonospora formicarum]